MTYVPTIPPCDDCGAPAYAEFAVRLAGRKDFRVGNFCHACDGKHQAQEFSILVCTCGFQVESPMVGPLVQRAKNRMLRHLNKSPSCELRTVLGDQETTTRPFAPTPKPTLSVTQPRLFEVEA